ncbi:hypothetical protein PCCS19_36130 [Paenibacillus sp. CCS19]|uniref:HNH endonuclease n=1 Tax=Paenibacillus sp. CCS19 TaxID=3158387 RepID=UPI002561DF2C|nr:HNH endonuclease signature motif containing protein [Paenibacillus cellulosilyticus]GMK40557.1 hypothetical protein PCCS19_36130 [Paenibacillus cellulosilyticus]
MRTLPKPPFTAEEVFRQSISRVKDSELKQRLSNCLPEIITDSDNFDIKASSAQLHLIQDKPLVNNDVTVEEMEAVYVGRMAKIGGPGRDYYNRLRNAPVNGKCPLCGQRPVGTLDHYLPKSKHPSLAVSPNNLVPACGDCNFIKKASQPTKSEEEPLHPYYDNIETQKWLHAEVVRSNPVAFWFYISPPPGASELITERVKLHFSQYKLADLYASEAASELADIAFWMRELHQSGGPEVIRQHLTDTARSCTRNQINSWKTAMYEALANDEWYWNFGAIQ